MEIIDVVIMILKPYLAIIGAGILLFILIRLIGIFIDNRIK